MHAQIDAHRLLVAVVAPLVLRAHAQADAQALVGFLAVGHRAEVGVVKVGRVNAREVLGLGGDQRRLTRPWRTNEQALARNTDVERVRRAPGVDAHPRYCPASWRGGPKYRRRLS